MNLRTTTPDFERSFTTAALTACLIVGALLAPCRAFSQAHPSARYTIDDLVGIWHRWPDNRGAKGVVLDSRAANLPGGGVSVILALTVYEQNEYGPMRPGTTPPFEGKFDASGFDVTYECHTSDLCFPFKYVATSAEKPTPDVVPRSVRRAPDIAVQYRYHIEFVDRDLLLVTAYTPKYTLGDKVFTQAKPEAVVRQLYLIRDDPCAKSRETVKKQVIEGDFGDRLVFAFAPPRSLTRGAHVREQGSRDDVFLVDAPACFFFIDPVPTAMYSHSVLYLLADQETGAVRHREWASATPVLIDKILTGGKPKPLYQTVEERFSSPQLIYPTSPDQLTRPVKPPPFGPPPPRAPVEANRRPAGYILASRSPGAPRSGFALARFDDSTTTKCTKSRKEAVLVNGGPDKPFGIALDQVNQVLQDLGFGVVRYEWKDDELSEIKELIRIANQDLGPCDVFVLYVVGHGLEWHEPQWGSNGDLNFHESWLQYTSHPWSLFNLQHNTYHDTGSHDTGPGLLYLLRNVKAGYIQVILDSCYSGRLIQAAISPSFGGPPIDGWLAPGQRLALFTGAQIHQPVNIAVKDIGVVLRWLWNTDFKVGLIFSQVLMDQMDQLRKEGDDDTNKDGKYRLEEYQSLSELAMDFATDDVLSRTTASKTLSPQEPMMFVLTK